MNENLVKSLREKTEEADLDTILKKSLGGYSRQSVREYVSMMRRQQYDMQQSFAEELQLCQSDRDRLSRELAQFKYQAEAAQEALAQAAPLMEKAAGLEKDMDEAVERIQADALLLEQLRQELEQQKAELSRVQSERNELRSRLENAETGTVVPELPTPQQAPEHRQTPQPEVFAEMPEANRGADVSNLVEWPETMQIQLALLSRERKNIVRQIESILHREKNLFQTLNQCWGELEIRREQNQCIEAENQELSRRLTQQIQENVSLTREIVRMRTINEKLKLNLQAAMEESFPDNTPNGSQDTGDIFLWNLAE